MSIAIEKLNIYDVYIIASAFKHKSIESVFVRQFGRKVAMVES